MKRIDKELESLKFKAFGKVKVREEKSDDSLSSLLKEKEKVVKGQAAVSESKMREMDDKICKELKKQQHNEMEQELSQLKKIKHRIGNAAAVSSIKEKLVGKKKKSEAPSAVVNPKTGKKVFTKSKIIRVSAEYCKNLLTNREP